MSIKCVKCGREDTIYSKPEGGYGCAHCERQALIDPGPADKRDTITFSVMENNVFEPVLVLTKEGMLHKGELVKDAGEAHRAWLAAMETMRKAAQQTPDPAIVEAWERYRRIAWGSDTTDDERDAANWELIKVIRQHVEKGGENERAIRDGGKTVSVLRGSGENSQVQM